jgi:hypothetical protein
MRIPRDAADAECCTRAASTQVADSGPGGGVQVMQVQGGDVVSLLGPIPFTRRGRASPIAPSARRNAARFFVAGVPQLSRDRQDGDSPPAASLPPRHSGLDAMTAPVIDYAGSLYLGS